MKNLRLILFLTLVPLSVAAGEWVNARDHRASGSEFATHGTIKAGSKKLTVVDVGDFAVGQGVVVYGGDVRVEDARIYDPGQITAHRPIRDEIEIRGFDAKDAKARTFALEVESERPLTFRWSNDYANNWKTSVRVTGDWQKLSDGVEVRFKRSGWKPAHLVVFHVRTDLISEVAAIDGKTLTLKHAATISAAGATVRHHDREALVRALRTALETKQNLFIPSGRYLLSPLGLGLPKDASIRIEGANPETTILDISEGKYHVLRLAGTKNVTVANLGMVGNSGWRKWPLSFTRINGGNFWTCNLRPTRAMHIGDGAEHTLIENVHASKMSGECFYAHGKYREGAESEPDRYQKSLTFSRCRVTDVLFNAFNNNDFGENTSILNCRVDGASNFWEGPSRFIRVLGNHVRNCDHYGTFGNHLRRSAHLNELGVGQTIIANNVFEGLEASDDPAYAHKGTGPTVFAPSTQVIIRDNHFVNFSSGAALRLGYNRNPGFPAGRIIASGNTIDLTAVPGRTVNNRVGIIIGTSDVTVSDNQIFVRNGSNFRTSGIRIEGKATNLNIHDNFIRNCSSGINIEPATAAVQKAIGPGVFLADSRIDKVRPSSHRYRGWGIHWLSGNNKGKQTTFAEFDTETLTFKLTEPLTVSPGDRFAYFPRQANWMIHHNTISGSKNALILRGYGSDTSIFSENLITRGQAKDAKIGVIHQGKFTLTKNTFAGFNDPEFGAIQLRPDPFGKLHRDRCVENVFRDCANEIIEKQ